MEFLVVIYHKFVKQLLNNWSSDRRIKYLRKQGMKIGQGCIINTIQFSTEPFLIEIGNNVLISSGTYFITHDGSISCFQNELQGGIYGKIKIGNNVNIGMNTIILYNTTIGNNCIIGAGSVVRGRFPDDSVIIGNPAKVVSSMGIQKMIFRNSRGFVKTNNLTIREYRALVKKHFGIE